MKKIAMFLAAALTCTAFASAAEAPLPQSLLLPPAEQGEALAPAETPADVLLPATPGLGPVDEQMSVTPEDEITAPEAPLPEEEAPAPEAPLPEEEAPAPEAPLPEQQPVVEIPENLIPIAPAPVEITIRAVVYDGETVVYDVSETVAANVGDTLDLDAYVWTETPGIALTGGAGAVAVSADTAECVLTYDLLDGWTIL